MRWLGILAWGVVLLAICAAIVLAAIWSRPVQAHIKDRSDLDPWLNSLQSKGGYPCCSHVDGSTIPDAEWDTSVVEGKLRYRVRIEGQWIVVTDEEVVESPNRFGTAIAWIYRGTNDRPLIRCFLPGAGG